MLLPEKIEPIDYLLIGHLTVDLTSNGQRLGGTVAYAGLTAHALGLRVGIVTSWGEELPLSPLEPIQVAGVVSDQSTTFENVTTQTGRTQILHHVAPRLDYYLIPDQWRSPAIVHLGPVAQEVEPSLATRFPDAFVCTTPQGWLRDWDRSGHVIPGEWPEKNYVLDRVEAVVISDEDVGKNKQRIEELAAASRCLAITQGENGAQIYCNGEERHFDALRVAVADSTGSGDIFAAIFFTHLFRTQDPWEAAELAARLASLSTTRHGLASIPRTEDIQAYFPASIF